MISQQNTYLVSRGSQRIVGQSNHLGLDEVQYKSTHNSVFKKKSTGKKRKRKKVFKKNTLKRNIYLKQTPAI